MNHQGETVTKLRKAAGWTQEELRERLAGVGRKISRPAISQLEGRRSLEGDLIADLLRVFRVSPWLFFNRSIDASDRQQEIARAFQFVSADPSLQMGGARASTWPSDAELAIVRIYEQWKNLRILPEEIDYEIGA